MVVPARPARQTTAAGCRHLTVGEDEEVVTFDNAGAQEQISASLQDVSPERTCGELQCWKQNFVRMSVCFAICESIIGCMIGLASSLMAGHLGQAGNGVIFLSMVGSALSLGPVIVGALGTKQALLCGFSLEAVYVLAANIALSLPSGSTEQWFSYVSGSVACGAGSGLAWTAQGVFFCREQRLGRQTGSA